MTIATISESEKTAPTQSLLELGARVREQRLLRDLTAEQLAAQTKLNRKTILDIEAGRDVRLSSFLRTIRALEVEENVIASLPKQKAADYLRNTRGQPRKRSLGTANPTQKPEAATLTAYSEARERKVFVIDFLLSEKNPGLLFVERKRKEIGWLFDFIREGPPDSLAMTDPSLFRRLSMRIIDLKLKGW